ncbi:hypothetical protein ACJX0J_039610 [Zea mays]
MRWTEAGYTTVKSSVHVQEDIEINGISREILMFKKMMMAHSLLAPLDDEGQAKDVILDDSERGLGFGYESIHVWHKEKRLGKNLMIHMASDSGSIQFCTLDVADEFAMFLIWKKEKFLQFVSNVDALQQMKEDIKIYPPAFFDNCYLITMLHKYFSWKIQS